MMAAGNENETVTLMAEHEGTRFLQREGDRIVVLDGQQVSCDHVKAGAPVAWEGVLGFGRQGKIRAKLCQACHGSLVGGEGYSVGMGVR
jgi:hypothetical protein